MPQSTRQHQTGPTTPVQWQRSAGGIHSPSLGTRALGSPVASPASTEWQGAATDALRVLLDSLQPAIAAILAHKLGADIWEECLEPRPPWRQARDMLDALRQAHDSLGMSHADSADSFGARDELWTRADELRRHREKDEVVAFVRRVLHACRQMLDIGRRCLASHAAAPDWPTSLDADHVMEQLKADDGHLRRLAQRVPSQ